MVLSAEVSANQIIEEILCIFTNPSKIDFKKFNVNTIQSTNLNEVWEKFFNDDRFGGIIINPTKEEVMVSYGFLSSTINNNFDEIEKVLKF